MIGSLTSFTLASFLVFFLLPTSPIISQWILTIFFSLFGVSIFHEWYYLPENTTLGKYCKNIFELSYQRTKHLKPEQALFDVKVLCISMCTIFLLGLASWFFPLQVFWFKWLIVILSGIMGTYFFNEEFKSPNGVNQRYLFFFSIIVFLLTVFFTYVLSGYEVEYSSGTHEFPIFIVTVGAWFSTGVIGAVLRAAFQLYRDKHTEEKEKK